MMLFYNHYPWPPEVYWIWFGLGLCGVGYLIIKRKTDDPLWYALAFFFTAPAIGLYLLFLPFVLLNKVVVFFRTIKTKRSNAT